MTETVVESPVEGASVTNEPAADNKEPTGELDWRREFAGEDEKFLNHLSKFNSPKDVAKLSFDFRQKLSSGEYKRNVPFPAEGTPEEQAEWRSENGIPEAPDKYSLPDGVVFGEDDQPIVKSFLEAMHKSNVPEGAAKEAIKWYHQAQEQTAVRMAEEAKMQKAQTEESLRGEWGAEYRPIMQMTENFVKTRFGDIMGEALLQSSPEVVKELASIARELNPAATLVPNSSNPLKGVQDQIAQYRAEMKNPDKWAKNTQGQKHLIELLAAEEKFK